MDVYIEWCVIAFDRIHSIYVAFHCRRFCDVPRVLIADARSFQALAAILDYVTHLALIDYLKLLYCKFQK